MSNKTVWEVYYEDGEKKEKQITLMDEIDVPSDSEVELIIKDDLNNKVAFDKGTKYIFGGENGPGRWICVQGLKVYYQPTIESVFTKENDYYIYTETEWNKYKDNLYWNFDLKDTQGNNWHFVTNCAAKKYTGSTSQYRAANHFQNATVLYYQPAIYKGEDERVYYPENTGNNNRLFGNSFIAENLKYCGYLIVATEISQDRTVTLRFLPIGFTENSGVISYNGQSYYYNNGNAEAAILGTSWVNAFCLQASSSPSLVTMQVPMSDFEYYYAMGLTDIYENKSITDVEDILENSNG